MNIAARRADFPLLAIQMNGKRLSYLDSAATSQKPRAVLDAVRRYYEHDNANVHRGVYELAARATQDYEDARQKLADLVGSAPEEIVFTRGTTESINLVARSYGEVVLEPGTNVVTSAAEHHSNLLPWQQAAWHRGAEVRYVELGEDGRITPDALRSVVDDQTRIVALAHVSNVMGTVTDVAAAAEIAHAHGAVLAVDGAQSVPHRPVDVRALGIDFLSFSGHKMCGPTGIGALYGRADLLQRMEPVYYGGEMIEEVTLQGSTWKEAPWRFEGGTPNIAGAVGIGAAADYLRSIGLTAIHDHEVELANYLADRIRPIAGVVVYGPQGHRDSGVVTFNLDGVHAHDVATALDTEGVCVRAGHHCCQPLMRRLQAASTARASLYLYNNREDVDQFVDALAKAKEFFHRVAG
ncbi:MAG: SufS family cysteine desulfurase [Thermaerobacter sp.]|nr:SufS family cysteine desulfurase [Thermaerobacter sp.]